MTTGGHNNASGPDSGRTLGDACITVTPWCDLSKPSKRAASLFEPGVEARA